MKFSDHLKYLSEGKLNEEKENDKTFSEEVKNFFLDKFSYAKLETDERGEYILVHIDRVKKIGDYQARVYPEGNNKIGFSFALHSNGESNLTTLMESPVISTTTKDYQKFATKWFKDTTAIVEKINSLV